MISTNTDGSNPDFIELCRLLDDYLNELSNTQLWSILRYARVNLYEKFSIDAEQIESVSNMVIVFKFKMLVCCI